MKSTCAINYFNAEYKESLHIRAQRQEENDNSVNYGVELYRFNVRCVETKFSSELIPTAKKLFLMCKTYCQKYVSIMFRKETINLQDEITICNIKLFLINLNRLWSANYVAGENVPNSAVQNEVSVLESRKSSTIFCVSECQCGMLSTAVPK